MSDLDSSIRCLRRVLFSYQFVELSDMQEMYLKRYSIDPNWWWARFNPEKLIEYQETKEKIQDQEVICLTLLKDLNLIRKTTDGEEYVRDEDFNSISIEVQRYRKENRG